MNVEKFIRVLGYIVYVALWLPVIVLVLLVMPIVWLVVFTRAGFGVKECATLYLKALKNSVKHDMEFIRTGVWY